MSDDTTQQPTLGALALEAAVFEAASLRLQAEARKRRAAYDEAAIAASRAQGIKVSTPVRLPDGTEIAEFTGKKSSPSFAVTDPAAFTAWMAANRKGSVTYEPVVRKSDKDALWKKLEVVDGQVVTADENGEIVPVPGVTHYKGGEVLTPGLRWTAGKEAGPEHLFQWLREELGYDVAVPSLTAAAAPVDVVQGEVVDSREAA